MTAFSSAEQQPAQHRPASLWSWLLIGTCLLALAALLAWYAHLFGYAYTLAQLPALPLAAGLVTAGAIYLPLFWVIRGSLGLQQREARRLLGIIIAFGFLMRLALFWSEPALEDDYQRYLWDGAVVANGLNPNAKSPAEAAKAPPGTVWRKLVKQSGKVHERINHPDLKTIYPPVTQGAFALAHLISPWNLLAWRGICLAAEAMTLWLLLLLLRDTDRSPLWVALYWWNPVVVKELINSAHMEAILMPLILAAFWFAIRQRFFSATTALGLAMGAKLWPLMLAPLILRQALARPKVVIASALLLVVMAALWALPSYLGGFDERSGLAAYAQRWKTGSALFPQIELLAATLLRLAELPVAWAAITARLFVTGLLGAITLWLAWRPIDTALDLMTRGAWAIAALLLLVPSQFPWYAIWLIPFLAFAPSIGLLFITVTIPLYYTAFYYIVLGQKQIFGTLVVCFIWLPVWALLCLETWWQATSWRRWRGGSPHYSLPPSQRRGGRS